MHTPDRFDLFSKDEPRVGVIIGTGPSLSADQLDQVKHLRKFGVNNAWQLGLDVHLACNWQWWNQYWPEIKNDPCHKWTPRIESATKYGVNYIEERWADGLSTDNTYIHAHHGSGPQMVNLALHYGCEKMILIGWDMRYSGKVSDRQYKDKRHYFGEYPKALQHWPRTAPDGAMTGLIKEMETINPADYGIEIVNCTPNSAMTCFESRELADTLRELNL